MLGAIIVGNCSGCHRIFSSIHGLCPLDASSTPSEDQSVSRGPNCTTESQGPETKDVTKYPKSPQPSNLFSKVFLVADQARLSKQVPPVRTSASRENIWYWGDQEGAFQAGLNREALLKAFSGRPDAGPALWVLSIE